MESRRRFAQCRNCRICFRLRYARLFRHGFRRIDRALVRIDIRLIVIFFACRQFRTVRRYRHIAQRTFRGIDRLFQIAQINLRLCCDHTVRINCKQVIFCVECFDRIRVLRAGTQTGIRKSKFRQIIDNEFFSNRLPHNAFDLVFVHRKAPVKIIQERITETFPGKSNRRFADIAGNGSCLHGNRIGNSVNYCSSVYCFQNGGRCNIVFSRPGIFDLHGKINLLHSTEDIADSRFTVKTYLTAIDIHIVVFLSVSPDDQRYIISVCHIRHISAIIIIFVGMHNHTGTAAFTQFAIGRLYRNHNIFAGIVNIFCLVRQIHNVFAEIQTILIKHVFKGKLH